jgi:O-antigen ligase
LIWSAGLAAFREHPFLGVGSGAYAATVFKVVNVPYVAHNTFISVLVELGVFGALLVLALMASLYYSAFRMRSLEARLWVTVLLTWTAGVMALAWEYRKPTWIMFGLLVAHAYSRRNKTIPFATFL